MSDSRAHKNFLPHCTWSSKAHIPDFRTTGLWLILNKSLEFLPGLHAFSWVSYGEAERGRMRCYKWHTCSNERKSPSPEVISLERFHIFRLIWGYEHPVLLSSLLAREEACAYLRLGWSSQPEAAVTQGAMVTSGALDSICQQERRRGNHLTPSFKSRKFPWAEVCISPHMGLFFCMCFSYMYLQFQQLF